MVWWGEGGEGRGEASIAQLVPENVYGSQQLIPPAGGFDSLESITGLYVLSFLYATIVGSGKDCRNA
jgi:hypothetical protein